MILTIDDVGAIQEAIERRSGLDQELLDSCGPLLRTGANDDAVRRSFVILETRLRRALHGVRGTGVDVAQRAFSVPNGLLSARLDLEVAEKEGLRDLFVGAFKLLRNPAAHGRTAYPTHKAKAIIAHVNLLLMLLEEIPPAPPELPQNVIRGIGRMSSVVSAGAGRRLRAFLEECVRMGLQPDASAKGWLPFRMECLRGSKEDPTPRCLSIAVFYLVASGEPRLRVEVNAQYSHVPDFDTSELAMKLENLGFRPAGVNQEPHANLCALNSRAFFEGLLTVVRDTVAKLDATLKAA